MAAFVKFHDRDQNVLRRLGVVGKCIVNSLDAFHRIWRRSLFSQVNDHMWVEGLKRSLELSLITSDVDLGKGYGLACELFPLL